MSDWTLEAWPLREQPEKLLAELHEASAPLDAEARPGDPRRPLAAEIARVAHLPAPEDGVKIVARAPGGAVAGYVSCRWEQLPGWDHVLTTELAVLPHWRRRGLGRVLAGRAVSVAGDRGLRLVTGRTRQHVPAGAAFARHLGAQAATVVRENRQDLTAVDAAFLRRQLDEGPARAPGYRLQFVAGATPPELAEKVAGVLNVMNTAPRDDLDIGDTPMTPELVRQYDQAAEDAGEQLWACYAVEEASGQFVGLSTLNFRPGEPDRAHVGDTAVEPAHRGRALGRWLKAAMTSRLLAEAPQVRWVITHNAGSNDAMLAINTQLGFRPVAEITTWQAPAGQLRSRLAGQAR